MLDFAYPALLMFMAGVCGPAINPYHDFAFPRFRNPLQAMCFVLFGALLPFCFVSSIVLGFEATEDVGGYAAALYPIIMPFASLPLAWAGWRTAEQHFLS